MTDREYVELRRQPETILVAADWCEERGFTEDANRLRAGNTNRNLWIGSSGLGWALSRKKRPLLAEYWPWAAYVLACEEGSLALAVSALSAKTSGLAREPKGDSNHE